MTIARARSRSIEGIMTPIPLAHVDPSPARISLGLLVLRVGAASLLIYGHGWGKLIHFGERSVTFSDPIGLGPLPSLTLVVFAEVFCSLAVLLGLFTRFAVLPPLIFFTVAFFIHHAQDPFRQKELALVYAVPFLTLLITGGGRHSVDAWLARTRARRRQPVA
jgi:putative oxidoreductase